jgi:hypothetical protein
MKISLFKSILKNVLTWIYLCILDLNFTADVSTWAPDTGVRSRLRGCPKS